MSVSGRDPGTTKSPCPCVGEESSSAWTSGCKRVGEESATPSARRRVCGCVGDESSRTWKLCPCVGEERACSLSRRNAGPWFFAGVVGVVVLGTRESVVVGMTTWRACVCVGEDGIARNVGLWVWVGIGM